MPLYTVFRLFVVLSNTRYRARPSAPLALEAVSSLASQFTFHTSFLQPPRACISYAISPSPTSSKSRQSKPSGTRSPSFLSTSPAALSSPLPPHHTFLTSGVAFFVSSFLLFFSPAPLWQRTKSRPGTSTEARCLLACPAVGGRRRFATDAPKAPGAPRRTGESSRQLSVLIGRSHSDASPRRQWRRPRVSVGHKRVAPFRSAEERQILYTLPPCLGV